MEPFAHLECCPNASPSTILTCGLFHQILQQWRYVRRTYLILFANPLRGKQVNEMILEPTNPVSEEMLENSTLYSLKNLNEDLQLIEGKDKSLDADKYATVVTGTMAYTQLVKALKAGVWSNVEDIDRPTIYQAPERGLRKVEITYDMGKELYEFLAKPIREVLERCINLEDFNVEYVRADGESEFNSPNGLHGQIIGSELDEDHKIRDDVLNKRGVFHVMARLSYFLLEE